MPHNTGCADVEGEDSPIARKSEDRNSRTSNSRGDRNSMGRSKIWDDDNRSRFSLPRGSGGYNARISETGSSSCRIDRNRRSAPLCGSNIRHSEGRQSTNYRIIGNIVPRMPKIRTRQLNPDDVNEHSGDLDLDFATTQGQELKEEIFGADGKVISVRQKDLISNKDGCMIEIRHISQRGTFYCVFDDPRSKEMNLELRKDLAHFYGENRKRVSSAAAGARNIRVGEIVVARVLKARFHQDNEMDMFIRANVRSIDLKNQTATVSDLDDYHFHEVYFQSLYKIDPHFIEQEANMIQCRIEQLEFFTGTDVVYRVLTECPLPEPMCYVMYFSGRFSEMQVPFVNITKLADSENTSIGKYVLSNLMAAVSPLNSLKEDKKLCRIVRCNSGGMVWLQFASDDALWDTVYSSLQQLSKMFSSFRKRYPLTAKLVEEAISGNKKHIYIMDFENQDTNQSQREIRRVTVSEVFPKENKVRVSFIDYGGSEIVSASRISPLEIFDETLHFIPQMVVKVRLEVIRHMKARMSDIESIVNNSLVIAKMIDEWPGEVLPPDVRILIPDDQLDPDFLDEEDEDDDDDYRYKGLAYSSRTLSGLLMRRRLAIPLTDNDKSRINQEKIRVSRVCSRQRRFSAPCVNRFS